MMAWVTLFLGLIGPRAVARGTLALRRLSALKSQTRSAGPSGGSAVRAS
jgi:hypothetical protein